MAAKRVEAGQAWAAYRVGHVALRDWLAALPAAAWSEPSVLPGWSVADLAAHIARVADSMTVLTAAPRGSKPVSVAEHLAGYPPNAESIADKAVQLADEAGRQPAGILALIDERFAAAEGHVEQLGLTDQPVLTRAGTTIRLGDFLATRVIEIAVHAYDFARSLPDVDPPPDPALDTFRMATRVLLDVLAERAPGRSVEVRVVPWGAIQCIEGPRHTRGTPPNVVSMSAPFWLFLAAGRITWAEAVASGAVHASGERADLSAHLPLL